MASSAFVRDMGGFALPTAHCFKSYCGQTFEVRHHQNNDMILQTLFHGFAPG